MTKQIKNVAVCICHDGNGRILFQERGPEANDYAGHWDFGGGAVEFGETLEAALIREIAEEYGCITVQVEQALPIAEHIQDGIHCILHPYIVRIDPDEIIISETTKITDISWHTIDDVPAVLHPGCERDITRFHDVLRQLI
jgi:mutator protein MutT